jgi:hypothetical protein
MRYRPIAGAGRKGIFAKRFSLTPGFSPVNKNMISIETV